MRFVTTVGCLTLAVALTLMAVFSARAQERPAAPPPTPPAESAPPAKAPSTTSGDTTNATPPATQPTPPASVPAPPAVAPTPAPIPAPAPAPTVTTPPANPTGPGALDSMVLADGKIILNFQNATLDSVLAFFSKSFGLAVINNNVKLDGRINVTSLAPMSVDEALDVLRSVLKDKGYTAIRTGKVLRIVQLSDAKTQLLPVHTGADPALIAQTDEFIMQVVPLKTADATQLKRDLSSFLPDYVGISANASTNTLMIVDTSADIRRLVEIIHAIDNVAGVNVTVKVTKLNYANAANAARLITQIFASDQTAQQGGANGRGRAIAQIFGGRGGGNPFAGGAQAAGEEGGRAQAKVTASSDDRTNTVVVSAPADMMGLIDEVLHNLDSDPSTDQTIFTVFLRNADATNVSNVVNGLFGTSSTGGTARPSTTSSNTSRTTSTSGGRSGSSSSAGLNMSNFGASASSSTARPSTSAVAGRPGGSSSQGSTAGQIYAIPDADTNSVLVMTPTGSAARVKSIIDELDRAVPQVLIKALLAEVTHSDGLDLGVNLSAIHLPNSGKTTVFTQVGTAAATAAGGPAGLVFNLVDPDVTVALRALETVGKLDVLSRPYILTSDNQPASIMVGEQVPIPTDSYTDSLGLTHAVVTETNIGIILNVTPHINPDGIVTMDVAPQISSLSGESVATGPGINIPIITQRQAQSRVAIRDGQTIVIGGMMQDTKTDTINKVPIIGDIPLIGLIFTRTQSTKAKTELIIFLTPHVALQPDVLKGISEEEKNNAVVVPKAVGKGVFDEQMHGMNIGGSHTPPSSQPATQPTPPPPVKGTDPAGP